MIKLITWFPYLHFMFMKIAEPRVTRLLHFGMYLFMLIAGAGVIYTPPSSFEDVIGRALVILFGWFIFIGALLAAGAILPGIWWLERAGLIFLVTGMFMYVTILLNLSPSPVVIGSISALMLTFIQR